MVRRIKLFALLTAVLVTGCADPGHVPALPAEQSRRQFESKAEVGVGADWKVAGSAKWDVEERSRALAEQVYALQHWRAIYATATTPAERERAFEKMGQITDAIVKDSAALGMAKLRGVQTDGGASGVSNVFESYYTYGLGSNGTVDVDGVPVSPWNDTGIELEPGDVVTIRASGTVTLKRLQTNNPGKWPSHPWLQPDGLSKNYQGLRPIDRYRMAYLLVPNEPYGALIAKIADGDPNVTGDAPVVIGKRGWVHAKRKGRLFVSVNDIWLRPDLGHVYAPAEEVDPGYYGPGQPTKAQREEEWKGIRERSLWNQWFADNAGSYTLSILVRKGGHDSAPSQRLAGDAVPAAGAGK